MADFNLDVEEITGENGSGTGGEEEGGTIDFPLTPITDPGNGGTTTKPEQTVTFDMVKVTYNAWRYNFKAVDSVTKAELHPLLVIDDVVTGKFLPWWVDLAPNSTFNIKLRLTGYKQVDEDITTGPLPNN